MGDRKAVRLATRRRGAFPGGGQEPPGLWAGLMRILLTGTDGQVGGALLPLLQGHGEILAPTPAEFDLSKTEALSDGLDRLRPDLIINPAAYTAVDRAEDEAGLAFSINAEPPHNTHPRA